MDQWLQMCSQVLTTLILYVFERVHPMSPEKKMGKRFNQAYIELFRVSIRPLNILIWLN